MCLLFLHLFVGTCILEDLLYGPFLHWRIHEWGSAWSFADTSSWIYANGELLMQLCICIVNPYIFPCMKNLFGRDIYHLYKSVTQLSNHHCTGNPPNLKTGK